MAPPAINASDQPKGYQKITSLSAATGLTYPSGARYAIIIPEGQAVRWRDDGTNPDASTGMPVQILQPFQYSGRMDLIKFIEQAASATLHVYYYR